MAKVTKNAATEQQPEANTNTNVTTAPEQEVSQNEVAEVASEEKELSKNETPASEKAVSDLPDNVAKIFESFPEYEQLWIDKDGGIFRNKPAGSSKAILYKNPKAKKA